LRGFSTMRVGGTAKVLVQPATREELCVALQKYPAHFILGGGSNVVFPDGVFDTPIICMHRLEIHPLPAASPSRVGGGVSTDRFVDFCLENGLGGMENFAGLPGTIGGAVFMNARCYDTEMSAVLQSVAYWRDGEAGTALIAAGEWGYKRSPFQAGGRLAGAVILGAAFGLPPLDAAGVAAAREKAAWCRADRAAKGHFRLPSCGSVFKNDRSFGAPTGKIIDALGLRGTAVGGAQVAPWHGNIIVNTGEATAADVRKLVELVEKRVWEAKGLRLEREIILLTNAG
jgi:UDP-N-acetylmuramate dehydrogenase